MLSVKKILYKILEKPIIVEYGKSGMWNYRKWSDGTVECWGYKSISTNRTQWGNSGWYYIQAEPDNYPSGIFVHTEVQYVSGQLTTSGGDSISSMVSKPSDLSVKPPKVTGIRPGTGTNPATGYAYWYAIGR